jgi:hypothetical protein
MVKIIMDKMQQAVLIGLAFGAVIGIYVARLSHDLDKIRGGTLAHIFHYLGVVCFVAVLPGVLASLILGGGFGLALPVGFGFVAASFIALVIYGAVEQPFRARLVEEDRGWTEQDARSSGL